MNRIDDTPLQLIAEDPAMKRVVSEAVRIAAFDTTTVLIEGETGTGKELLARHIHQWSSRSHGPFVIVDCSAIPGSLIESELFGYERGAFTGAVSTKIGLLERAQGGTLFLDEVSSLDQHVQCILLRFLDTQEYRRLGNGLPTKVDARIIAASNRNLGEMADAGKLRLDLYHRLLVARVQLPPLFERKGDIPILFRFFLKYLANHHGVGIPEVEDGVDHILMNYSWPGNVRQLRNACESMLITSNENGITVVSAASYTIGQRFTQALDIASQHTGYIASPLFLHNFMLEWTKANGCYKDISRSLRIAKSSVSRYATMLSYLL